MSRSLSASSNTRTSRDFTQLARSKPSAFLRNMSSKRPGVATTMFPLGKQLTFPTLSDPAHISASRYRPPKVTRLPGKREETGAREERCRVGSTWAAGGTDSTSGLRPRAASGLQTPAHQPRLASACFHDILLTGAHAPSFTCGLWWLPHHNSRAESCDRLCGPQSKILTIWSLTERFADC